LCLCKRKTRKKNNHRFSQPGWETKNLVLGDSVKNILGETITVERFRYYVSNFSVQDEKGVLHANCRWNYFLVDEEDPSTKTITLTVPSGQN
jgi:hypothetical protein